MFTSSSTTSTRSGDPSDLVSSMLPPSPERLCVCSLGGVLCPAGSNASIGNQFARATWRTGTMAAP